MNFEGSDLSEVEIKNLVSFSYRYYGGEQGFNFEEEDDQPKGLPMLKKPIFDSMLEYLHLDGSYEAKKAAKEWTFSEYEHPVDKVYSLARHIYSTFSLESAESGFTKNLSDWLYKNIEPRHQNTAAAGTSIVLASYTQQFGADFIDKIEEIEGTYWEEAFGKAVKSKRRAGESLIFSNKIPSIPAHQVLLNALITKMEKYFTDESAVELRAGAVGMFQVLDTALVDRLSGIYYK